MTLDLRPFKYSINESENYRTGVDTYILKFWLVKLKTGERFLERWAILSKEDFLGTETSEFSVIFPKLFFVPSQGMGYNPISPGRLLPLCSVVFKIYTDHLNMFELMNWLSRDPDQGHPNIRKQNKKKKCNLQEEIFYVMYSRISPISACFGAMFVSLFQQHLVHYTHLPTTDRILG